MIGLPALILGLMTEGSSAQTPAKPGPYDKQWKEADAFMEKSLPKSALGVVDKIYADAVKTGRHSERIRAVMYRTSIQATFQEDVYGETVKLLRDELARTREPLVKAILESMLAETFRDYYDMQSWIIDQRTPLKDFKEPDFNLWDARRIAAEVTLLYRRSLTPAKLLQATPIDDFSAILEKASGSAKYRPTLYDFLAHRALEYFTNQYGYNASAESFTEYNNPALLSDNQRFLKMVADPADTLGCTANALRIFQELIRLHLADTAPEALIELTVYRLEYAKNLVVNLPDKDSLYLSSLETLSAKYNSSQLYPWLRYKVALWWFESGDADNEDYSEENRWNLKTAREICIEAIENGRGREGISDCKSLLAQIERPHLELNAQEVYLPGEAMLYLTSFKNIPEVHYRLIRISRKQLKQMGTHSQEDMAADLAKMKPVHQWSITTRDPGDYRSHAFEYGVPEQPTGQYVLLASKNADFTTKDNELAWTSFQVSRIALIQRVQPVLGGTLLVTDRQTGIPLQGITVVASFREYNYQKRQWIESIYDNYVTNADGIVFIPVPEESGSYRNFSFECYGPGGDTLFTNDHFSLSGKSKTPVITIYQTHLFLDRKIYRPGQTLYFKGIVVEIQGKEKKAATWYRTDIRLMDVNGREVGRIPVVANIFGSFQGSFVLPSTGLTGQMSISCETGSEYFSVEEYKRPKFEVKMDPVAGVFRPGDEVNVTGKAEAYAGYNLTGAKVVWQVEREKEWQWGYPWRYYPGRSNRKSAISQGEATIGEDGLFRITFRAEMDPSEPMSPETVFRFLITADVTDLNGETHSAEGQVRVGQKTLEISCSPGGSIDRAQKPEFQVSTSNLNGEAVKTIGTWQLWRRPAPPEPLRKRLWTAPDLYVMDQAAFNKMFPNDLYGSVDPYDTLTGELVGSGTFVSGKESPVSPEMLQTSQPGRYYLVLETSDTFGQKVTLKHDFILFDKAASTIPVAEQLWVKPLKTKAEPGETVTLLVGSAVQARVRFTIELNGKMLEDQWIVLNREQKQITFNVLGEHRGGVAFHLAMVYNNRPYTHTSFLQVPFSNKTLDIRFATFRDKLQPGEQEEYRVTIIGHTGDKVMAELLAGMYDASLDAFASNSWQFWLYEQNGRYLQWNHQAFGHTGGTYLSFAPRTNYKYRNQQYDRLNWYGYLHAGSGRGRGFLRGAFSKGVELEEAALDMRGDYAVTEETNGNFKVRKEGAIADSLSVEDLPDVEEAKSSPAAAPPRTNFSETAFFFPQLMTDAEGNVVFSYKVPESLTAWKLMCLAHTPDLRIGTLEKQLVTRKELMVVPNAPRFFREQDQMTFTAKVTNLSQQEQVCSVTLKLSSGLTGAGMDALCRNLEPVKQVSVAPGQSGVVQWDITIPEGAGAITYRVTATSGSFSDGEEMTIPVLTNRMLVTETMPMPVNGAQTREFTFEKLAASGNSRTLKHHKLTLEYTSNPAWYAIQALPYLMEFPYECSEQLFSRYFANAMAGYIANSSQQIKAVFDSWKTLSPDALRSNLEKNQELKGLLLEETPWLMEGASETDRKQRVALLFDLNRMAGEKQTILMKLQEQQTENGGWPWFKGGPDSWYITQHIVIGVYRLQSAGVISLQQEPELEAITSQAVYYLDQRMEEYFNDLKKNYKLKPADLEKNHLNQLIIQYLYLRAGFESQYPLRKSTSEAWNWLKKQALQYWTTQDIMMQGYLALAMKSLNEGAAAADIVKSLKERSLHKEEMGMYWAGNAGYYWYEAPIERQALMIEVFDQVAGDRDAVEQMKIWLLKQKQTTDWKTTKATTEACFALLMRGSNLLAQGKPAEIRVGKKTVDPYQEGNAPEAGTGYFKVSWSGSEVTPKMADVQVTTFNEGASWGAVYWQYFEQLDKITGQATPLALKKQLFVEEKTAKGTVMRPVTDTTALQVGDRIVVRIELRADRDMEYVHMKDMRASALEPETTLSGYRWQQGLGYYESPRDAAVNFFFDYLRKGTYVFEYRLRATHTGDFSNGITTIQCMYAPEFASHSEGKRILIKN